MSPIVAGLLSLAGVVLGAVLFGGRSPRPLYLPPIANTAPPTCVDPDPAQRGGEEENHG